jgi:hypothetical protein
MGDMGDYWKDVKAAKKLHTQAVMRVDQSPMNAKRWCLTLRCGHEAWVTRHGRPKLQGLFCERCSAQAAIKGETPT